MITGITRDKLIDISKKYSPMYCKIILDIAGLECEHLDPWLIVGSNTPKDQELLLCCNNIPSCPKRIGLFDSRTETWTVIGAYWNPTHYKILKGDPE